MYLTASPTVFSFGSSSSGILTPNFSSAAIATSTIDSESTSRSSTKLLSSVTSSGCTSATSLRIVARPDRMSSSFAMCLPFGVLPVDDGVVERRPGGRRENESGGEHDLRRVGETGTEPEQQRRSARGQFALLGHA